MDRERNQKHGKIGVFILGTVLILAVLSLFAVCSSAVMRFLGFEYESIGDFILYFVISFIVSYPLNFIADLPKALLSLDKISREVAVSLYVLLDTITTCCGFGIVDYFMPSVSANAGSLLVLALVFALFGVGDVRREEP